MRSYEKRMFLLLIDFDNDDNRLKKVCDEIPKDLQNRVFVLGSGSEPKNLKKQINLNSLEDIGKALSEDCVNDMDNTWGHPLLKHNKSELERMIITVKPFLFY